MRVLAMGLREDILLDLILEGSIPVSEAAAFVTPGVKKQLKATPIVSKKELLDTAESGDILITFTPKRKISKSTFTNIKAKLMTLAQGSPFTSSKLVFNDNTIAGYDAAPRTGVNVLQHSNIDNFVNRWIQEAMLIRPIGRTEAHVKGVQSYFRKRFGLDYNKDQVMKSSWKRLFKKLLPFLRKETELTPKQLGEIREPLFCSNIIAVAYKAAGYRKPLSKVLYDTWPRDFIISPNTEKICRIEYA
jgi:hypothetical protein